MKQDVLNFIEEHRLFASGGLVIVAVSGGPDSMALLHFLFSHREQLGITVMAAHGNHQLRQEADEEETFVHQFCLSHGILFTSARLPVKERMEMSGEGVQVTARELRYKWLEAEAKKHGAAFIATGHHGDDQIETILMKQVRGTFPLSRGGIPVRREVGDVLIVRPFLGITKGQIEHYCKEVNIEPKRDPSNNASSYTRNRFRHTIIPFIRGENPNAHLHFRRISEWKEEDECFLLDLAENALADVLLHKDEHLVTIDRDAFLNVGLPLQRRMIHLILKYLYTNDSPANGFIHIERIETLIRNDVTGTKLHLPMGITVERVYGQIRLVRVSGEKQPVPVYPVVIEGEGQVSTPFGRFCVVQLVSGPRSMSPFTFTCSASDFPLTVRSRRTGDRIVLSVGTKKVSRLFIDKKVEREVRDRWPLVFNQSSEIVSVPGLYNHPSQKHKQDFQVTFTPKDVRLEDYV
ncbi:tRNA lysidine(34) synthetase TilS [Halalkalibacterium halodurans]|uniref:tRNA lysidine(34) synthetase TilS n=1 Tax=Halalkalibacterium halodurans TaxID=86665 RepID=UPI002AA97DC4|nr:tRNA lysidine(34) synthetase TilS [Halalkalibacterium halodurans]MDY7220586.1 tRNA lysidine(34) synthetase TilS [Halalkalibacterium halodurans]MDY7239825.1 tRNA lysidine(34) synthetase TilS [Halalkalibacterium halodurans]